MATTLYAELYMLSNWLARIAAGNRYTRDYTASVLRKTLLEIAAQFPVYRTYVSARGVSENDRRVIDSAVSEAKHATRAADPSVFDFVRSVLLLEIAPSEKRRKEMLRFAMRFQQFTAPVVAKGIEDTAFYRYSRLIALNEVGGNASRFGLSLAEFHAAAEARAALAGDDARHLDSRHQALRGRARAPRRALRARVRLAHDAAALEPDEPGRHLAQRRVPLLSGARRHLARRGFARAHRAPEGLHAESRTRGERAHELDQSGHGIRALARALRRAVAAERDFRT